MARAIWEPAGVVRVNKASNVYNVGRGLGEKGRHTRGGRADVDVGGLRRSRMSLGLTACQSISSHRVEISAIDKHMNIVNNK